MGRKWGQHFLRSQATIEKIVQAAAVTADEVVLEIGPGEGVLTKPLCAGAARVHAVEIDPDLAHTLALTGPMNLQVHQVDFLKASLEQALGEDFPKPLVVAANLPYYITAPILERLFWERPVQVKRAVLMMQDEVARRICRPATREAGALTYIAGAFFEARYLFSVPPGCFSPPPKVDSAVIEVTPRSPGDGLEQELATLYERLVGAAFRARRKQMGTSLKSVNPDASAFLQQAGIDPKRRPETMTVQEFWTLTRNWGHRE